MGFNSRFKGLTPGKNFPDGHYPIAGFVPLLEVYITTVDVR